MLNRKGFLTYLFEAFQTFWIGVAAGQPAV